MLAGLCAHPRVLALLDRLLMPNFLLSTMQSIRLHPGEVEQAWHTDDAFYFMPRPHALPLAVSAIWAIDDFTEDNGATELIPGSHRWGDERPEPNDPRMRKVVMPSGSVVVFLGTVWHRGGANATDRARLGITPQYCQPWARQLENMVLAVPQEVAATYPRRVQELLGYSIHPPLMGYVNGMHPARLIDPEYGKRDRVEARRAAEIFDRRR